MGQTWVWGNKDRGEGGGGAALRLHPDSTRRQVGRVSALYGTLLVAVVIAPSRNARGEFPGD